MDIETQRFYNCRVRNEFLTQFELQAAVAMLGGPVLCSACGGTGQDDPPPGKYHGLCSACGGRGKQNILFSELLSRLTQAALGANVSSDEVIDTLSMSLKQVRKYKKGGGR